MTSKTRVIELTKMEAFLVHHALGKEIMRLWEPYRPLLGTPEEPPELPREIAELHAIQDRIIPPVGEPADEGDDE